MKKSVRLIVSLLLTVVFTFTGCSSRPTDAHEWKDPSKPTATLPVESDWRDPGQEWKDPSKPSNSEPTSGTSDWRDPGQEWKDPSKPSNEEPTSTTSDWRDPGQEWKDPSKPTDTDPGAVLVTAEVTETEPVTEPPTEPTEPTSGYRHQIGDFVFYTEHDINDYIGFDGRFNQFYASKMVADIFGSEEMYIGYGEINAAIDFKGERDMVALTYGIYNDNNKVVDTRAEGDWFGFELNYVGYIMFIKHLREPEGDLYVIDERVTFVDDNIILLSLYMCENAADWHGQNLSYWKAMEQLRPFGYYIWDVSGGAQ